MRDSEDAREGPICTINTHKQMLLLGRMREMCIRLIDDSSERERTNNSKTQRVTE